MKILAKSGRHSIAGTGRVAISAVVLAVLLLAGCATSTRSDDSALREFSARAYTSLEQQPVTDHRQTLLIDGQPVKLVLSWSRRPGMQPLLLYLPGLGETSEAGAVWRKAWAAAGYAVLSVQALEDDAGAWQSELARAGEFRQLARERYATTALNQRLRVLGAVWAEGRRRSAAGEAGWAALDWQRLAVAGFDLGAYTAMALAGEHIPGLDAALTRIPLQAVVLLSPHASLAAGALDSRFADVRLPVLSVTSDVDSDLLGLVEGPYLRDAPHERMPGPDKLLLSLQGLPHAGLAGGARPTAQRLDAADAAAHRDAGARGDGDNGGGQRSGGKRGNPGGNGGGAGSGSGGGSGKGGANVDDAVAATGGAMPRRQSLSADTWQMRVVAVQAVSTAFLDARLKDDTLARDWLAADAQRWLGRGAVLRRK